MKCTSKTTVFAAACMAACRIFAARTPISFDITLTDAPRDSMVIVTPFAKDEKAFYYNQKINCLRAEGRALFAGREYLFSPATSFAVLDWGRGVWTYENTWYWGSASGIAQGRRVGFNVGYGFGDTSAASENMVFVDGVAHKLSQVTFNIPMKNGQEDYLSPGRLPATMVGLRWISRPSWIAPPARMQSSSCRISIRCSAGTPGA